ncbi:MAG: DUF342 domain-containing protein [Vallitaleaceae bacterium]|nr:DUF342 domain-containing protein [Vallitaleaceae bacterium]
MEKLVLEGSIMVETTIYSNDFVHLYLEEEEIWLKVLKMNYSIQALNDALKEYPRISMVHFVALKAAITNGISSPVKVGILKPKIELSISSDKMTAHALINLTKQEFDGSDKKTLIAEIIDLAVEESISYGVDIKGILQVMKPLEKFEIAKGDPPISGIDAIIRMYEIKKVEPSLIQDGNVNHYEMNLINKVDKGAWLGERIEPTMGIMGKNILGEDVAAPNGRQEKLKYDAASVTAFYDSEKNKTILYAGRSGAVIFDREIISVCNFIEISGDVSFHTGNVDFDGFVDVKKSVDDNFSVIASYDIQVLGDMGIGGVDTIQSRDGSIYIRGGIAGKNKAKIMCKGDFYTKFASDCIIECEGTVNIGYYAMNCTISAKEVVLASSTSKIIGGVTKAVVRVEVGELGSKAGIQTRVVLSGFDREQLKNEYDEMAISIEKIKDRLEHLKRNLSKYAGDSIRAEEREKYEVIQEDYHENKKNLELLLKQRKKYTSYLRVKGEGEVKVNGATYQNVILKMRDEMLVTRDFSGLPTTYFLENGEIQTN